MGQPICAGIAGRSDAVTRQFVRADAENLLSPGACAGPEETHELHVDAEVLQVHIQGGEIEVQQGQARKADVVLYTDMPTYLALLSGEMQPEEASERGLIRIEGDPEALRRFLKICGLPSALEKVALLCEGQAAAAASPSITPFDASIATRVAASSSRSGFRPPPQCSEGIYSAQFDHKLRQINGGLTFVADEVIAKGVAIDPAVDRPGEGVVACRVALSERKPPEKRIPAAPGDRPHWDENR